MIVSVLVLTLIVLVREEHYAAGSPYAAAEIQQPAQLDPAEAISIQVGLPHWD